MRFSYPLTEAEAFDGTAFDGFVLDRLARKSAKTSKLLNNTTIRIVVDSVVVFEEGKNDAVLEIIQVGPIDESYRQSMLLL
ncbi:MAG: hypothetical protein ACK5PB_07025 [Pirellula sp.]